MQSYSEVLGIKASAYEFLVVKSNPKKKSLEFQEKSLHKIAWVKVLFL